jgi:hypothetical protein
MGLFTAAGTLALKNGLSPFAGSAFADSGGIPTGLPRSPLFGIQPFKPLGYGRPGCRTVVAARDAE